MTNASVKNLLFVLGIVLASAALSLGVFANNAYAADGGWEDYGGFGDYWGGYEMTPDYWGGYEMTPDYWGGYEFTPDYYGGYEFSPDYYGGFEFTPDYYGGMEFANDYWGGMEFAPAYHDVIQETAYIQESGYFYADSFAAAPSFHAAPMTIVPPPRYTPPVYVPPAPVVPPVFVNPQPIINTNTNTNINTCTVNSCNTTTTITDNSINNSFNTVDSYNVGSYNVASFNTAPVVPVTPGPIIQYQAPVPAPITPTVSLSQIPYTGFDLGPVGNAIYWLSLITFAAAGAYLALYYQGGAYALVAQTVSGLRSRANASETEAIETTIAAPAPLEEKSEINAFDVLPVAETFQTRDSMTLTRTADGTPRIVINRA